MNRIVCGLALALVCAAPAFASPAAAPAKEKLEVLPANGGGAYWHLVAANGEKLCASQIYKGGHAAAVNAAKAAKATGTFAANYKPMMSGKQHSWHLIAANKKDILCNGEGYANVGKASEGMKAAQHAFKSAAEPK